MSSSTKARGSGSGSGSLSSSSSSAGDITIVPSVLPSPTPSPSTSALGDDSSSPSAAATAALSTLTTCMKDVALQDLRYAQCIMNSGLFTLSEEQPFDLRQRLRNTSTPEGLVVAFLRTQLSPDDLRSRRLGQCRLQCTAPAFHASSSCCDATQRLRQCQLASPTPALEACKRSIDQSLAFSNQECSPLLREDAALVAVMCTAVAVVGGFYGFTWYRRRRQRLDQAHSTDVSHVDKIDEFDPDDTAIATRFRQVGVLVWKNLILRIRRPVALVFEQIVPLFFVLALVILANLDSIFGRNGDSRYRKSHDAAVVDDKLLCVTLSSLSASDLGAPSGTMRSFYSSGQSVIGLFFLLSFIKYVSSMTASMVHEKEIKMREMMKIMGVSNSALLVSWVVTNTLLSFPVVLVLAAMLKFGNVFPTTPYATVVFVFWSLSLAIVAFAYALTPFFHKSRTAAIFSVLVWLLLYFPFFDVQPKLDGRKYAGALAPPTAFALAVDRLLREAQLGTGFAYSMTAAASTTEFVGVPTAEVMSIFMLLDALILLLLGWYFEQVLPQQFGVRKPWYFLFQFDYWRPHSTKFKMTLASSPNMIQSPSFYALGSPQLAASHSTAAGTPVRLRDSETPAVLNIPDERRSSLALVEPVSTELALQEHTGASLQLRALTKTFKLEDGEEKRAVDNLTLTFYAGQITSLLGHNGAGKTTTISMLTGLYPPTSGDALLFGRSLQLESDAFRRIMGVCPQHDVLFPELTVEEHLRFFAIIKGLRGRDKITFAMDSLIDDVGLTGSRRVLSKNLSGGQKRKLSVALALLGNSKLVFFDEPTSGMDPYSRRFTWNMLRRQRDGRVIVLTTHFMDEADVLGDRIAIMADGKLRCVGSSLFLKNRYGAGYNLTMIKANEDVVFQTAAVTQFLEAHLGAGESQLASDSASEVVFTLSSRSSDRFAALFDALDREMTALAIRNYGISVTTLEDVFLRIANDRGEDHDDDQTNRFVPTPIKEVEVAPGSLMSKPAFTAQVKTQLLKRWWISKRDKKSLINAIGIPLLLLILLATLPEIEVASFLPDYATSFPTQAQQDACPAANITANLLAPSTMDRCMNIGYGFCSLGLVDCDAAKCCDATYYQSPFYACSTCPIPTGPNVSIEPCYSSKCMRRNGAKLQVALNAFVAAMIVMLAFAFIPAAIIAFVVREKDPSQDARSLQWISGMSLSAYWTANYAHDLVVIAWSVLVALIAAPVSHRSLAGADDVGALILLVITHALCIIPMTYLYSRRFTNHASAQTSMLVFTLSSGGLLSIFSFLCRVVDFSMTNTLTLSSLDRDYLRWFFLLFPGYALNNGIYEIATRKITRGSLYGGGRNSNPQASFFGLFKGFGKNLRCQACWNRNTPGCCVRGSVEFDVSLAPSIYMLLEAIAFTLLVFYLEKRATLGKQASPVARETMLQAPKFGGDDGEDDDVVAERYRVGEMAEDTDDAIVIQRLQHQYPDGRVALQNLSLAIPKGECFGYLGVNGAGKSTTIKVLTRQIVPTFGSVSVAGRDLADRTDTTGVIGYCPQFDALHDLLTVEEELTLYARIKGISDGRIPLEVDEKIHDLGLHEYRDKLTRGLSGGNKRKVSTAIALLGSPPIVILDEPSTGMDPSARRKMWNVIASTCTVNQTSVVLTTHSMEECEALCSRVGILVQGQLKCLGSVQHLRQKFGRGYTVDIKLDSEPTKEQVAALRQRAHDILGIDVSDVSDVQVAQLCDALGNPERSEQLHEAADGSAEWWSGRAADGLGPAMALDHFASWWLTQDRHDALLSFFPQKFPGTTLVEQHGDHVRFHIPKHVSLDELEVELRPKEIFEALEVGKQQLCIQEYSVSDTSLEHIFNRMADDSARAERGDRASAYQGDQPSLSLSMSY